MPSDKTIGGGDDAFNTFFSETGAGKPYHVQYLSTLSQQLLRKSVLALTANCSIQKSSSLERKMLLTTLPVDITPSEKRSSILSLTAFVSSLTTALVYRESDLQLCRRWNWIWPWISAPWASFRRLRKEIQARIHRLPISTGLNSCSWAIQLCAIYPFSTWAHWRCHHAR